MSNGLSGCMTFRGVCGAEECGGLGYDAAKSKNVAASGNGGVKSTLFAPLDGGAGMGGGCGGCDAPRLGPNVRK